MWSLDIMMVAAAVGVLSVCSAVSYKIVLDARQSRVHKVPIKLHDDDIDPMNQRLHELRNARFGKAMIPKVKIVEDLAVTQARKR